MSAVCPVCGAIDARVPECRDCRAVLHEANGSLIAAQPLIRRGDVLASRDLRVTSLPGKPQRIWSSLDGTAASLDPQGIVVTTMVPGTISFVEPWVRLRDTCVRAAVSALDADLLVGVVARRERIGDAQTFYALDLWPERQSVRLARCFSTPDEMGVFDLVPWTPSSVIVGVGGWNEIELRVQGSALEAWVNGQRLLALHDSVLGIGWTGMRLTRVPATSGVPLRACCGGFEVTMVSA